MDEELFGGSSKRIKFLAREQICAPDIQLAGHGCLAQYPLNRAVLRSMLLLTAKDLIAGDGLRERTI